MKRFRVLFGLLAALALGPVFAPAVVAAPTGSVVAYEIGPSTTSAFLQVATGEGWLYDIQVSSGATGEYAVCFDSASVTGLTVNTNGSTSVPRFQSFVIDATSAPVHMPLNGGATGVGFTNGLACAQTGARRTYIYYRED